MKIRCKRSVLPDSQESCLADLAVISSKFLIPYRGVGILAIIGPVNLDYQQLINQVQCGPIVFRPMKLTDFTATSAVIITKD